MASAATSPRHIALLSDFGSEDVYVGVMKGVIAGIAPAAVLIDVSHKLPPQNVRAAAVNLLFSYRYFPMGTVFCCVVDPGVGSERKALAVELEGEGGEFIVVCPDNGLLTPLLPLVRRAVLLSETRYRLSPVSATFHGRDIFAPAAAHLAAGVALGDLGPLCTPDELQRLEWPAPRRLDDGWMARVIHVDRFGNLISDLPASVLEGGNWQVGVAGCSIDGVSRTFADVDAHTPVAYIGSSGFLELAVRNGNAAAVWGTGVGDIIEVKRRP